MRKRGFEGAGTEKSKIMIADDHPIFRFGLREIIQREKDLEVCGEAEDAVKARYEIQRLKPALITVDLSLKGGGGLNLIKDINRDYAEFPVLVISMHDEIRFAERSLQAGARGYIMKQETVASVVKAIRCVLAGKIYLSEKLKDLILVRFAGGSGTEKKSCMDMLSDRELEVFRLIGHGFGTNEIALQLNLSVKTIGSYRERIKEKLKLNNGNELVRHAMYWSENQRFK